MGVERSQKTENKNLHGVVDDILVEVDGDDLVSILSGELHDAVAHGTHADHTNFFDLFADAGRGGEAACSSFSDTFGKHDGWFGVVSVKVGDASHLRPLFRKGKCTNDTIRYAKHLSFYWWHVIRVRIPVQDSLK